MNSIVRTGIYTTWSIVSYPQGYRKSLNHILISHLTKSQNGCIQLLKQTWQPHTTSPACVKGMTWSFVFMVQKQIWINQVGRNVSQLNNPCHASCCWPVIIPSTQMQACSKAWSWSHMCWAFYCKNNGNQSWAVYNKNLLGIQELSLQWQMTFATQALFI